MLAKRDPFVGSIARSASELPLFGDLFKLTETRPLWEFFPAVSNTSAVAPADIYETQDELVIRMDVPGFEAKDVDIKVEGDVLTIAAERTEQAPEKATWLRNERVHGKLTASYVLPKRVDAAKCEAKLAHGVLTVALPKAEEARPRSIAVKVNG